MGYSYKQLVDSDVRLFKQLLPVFGEAFQDSSTYQHNIPTDEYIKALLAKSHFITLIVMNDEQVVGGLTAYQLDKFEQDRREIYIYDLAVSENHRRKGLATGLITELKRIAKERKAYVIYVQADVVDAPAIALYDSLGKKEEVFHFDILVD